MAICPRCGRETEKFYDNLCLNCYLERMKPITINIKVCKKCGRYFISNKGFESLDDAINFYIKKFLRKKLEFIDYLPKEKINVNLKEFVCKECKEKYSRKIEAIIQIRGNKSKEIMRRMNLEGKEKDSGFDIEFSSKEDAKQLVKNIKKKYKKSRVKISRKLVGLKNGKKVYKDTFAVIVNE